jgi:hypothetical protein
MFLKDLMLMPEDVGQAVWEVRTFLAYTVIKKTENG